VKILDKTRLDAKTRRLLSREITSMEKMHHPNIIRLYEVVETLSKLYIMLEYAAEGELYTRITSNPDGLPESDAKFAFAQIVSAVQHMVGIILHYLLSSTHITLLHWSVSSGKCYAQYTPPTRRDSGDS